MGGYGSTRWGWYSKKRTVEQSLRLDTGFLVKLQALTHGVAGSCRWGQSYANWRMEACEDGRFVCTLSYTFLKAHEQASIQLPILMFPTSMPNGGKRYWFKCPLQGCKKSKVRKLYLPAGSKYFGCRQCHGLVYSSSQESRKPSSFIWALGSLEGLSYNQVRKIWSR